MTLTPEEFEKKREEFHSHGFTETQDGNVVTFRKDNKTYQAEWHCKSGKWMGYRILAGLA